MSGILSVYSQLLSDLDSALHTMLSNPLAMLRFTIPLVIIVFSSFIARRYQKIQKIDAMPSFEKKRELFRLPQDVFNLEVSKILEEDYSDVIYRIKIDFQDAHARVQEYKRLIRKYKRYEGRLNSSFKRIRESAVERRREVLDNMIKLHDGLRYNPSRRA